MRMSSACIISNHAILRAIKKIFFFSFFLLLIKMKAAHKKNLSFFIIISCVCTSKKQKKKLLIFSKHSQDMQEVFFACSHARVFFFSFLRMKTFPYEIIKNCKKRSKVLYTSQISKKCHVFHLKQQCSTAFSKKKKKKLKLKIALQLLWYNKTTFTTSIKFL